VSGSRFWALAHESSDEEEEPEVAAAFFDGISSVESGPTQVTFGDFLSPAWQKVTALKSGVGARRRSKFAPGGRGSRFGGGGLVARHRPDLDRFFGAAQTAPARSPSPSLQGAATVLPYLSVRSPRPSSSPVAAVVGAGVGGASPVEPVGPVCQGPGGGSVAGGVSG
jgi:hypothetical protein